MTSAEARYIVEHPVAYAIALGYDKLVPSLHDNWIRKFAYTDHDMTLQAHRESYKTTCLIAAISLRMILFPNEPMLALRKDQDAVKEVIRAVRRNLCTAISNELSLLINGKSIVFERESQLELQTNLMTDTGVKESQLIGDGVNSYGLTGKHYRRIYTDDIVNLADRVSRAARTNTDNVYQELQNVRMTGGTIINSGTPWHKNDTFRLMPTPERYDVYSTGLMPESEILHRKNSMTASLFAANYELKHIADEESYFSNPQYGVFPQGLNGVVAHVDGAFQGSNTTALTIIGHKDGKYYMYGKVFHTHVNQHYHEIVALMKRFNAGTLFLENNADKGFLAEAFMKIWSPVSQYHEGMNKHVKIVSYLLSSWANIVWDKDTDPLYMEQIVDYTEGMEPDDAPDSAASILRQLQKGVVQAVSPLGYRR